MEGYEAHRLEECSTRGLLMAAAAAMKDLRRAVFENALLISTHAKPTRLVLAEI